MIQLKEMMSFMEMMQPQDGQGNDSFNPADLFSGIFPADLQEQFHMYSDLFSSVSQNQEHDETDAQQKERKRNFKKYLKSFIERNYQYERLDE